MNAAPRLLLSLLLVLSCATTRFASAATVPSHLHTFDLPPSAGNLTEAAVSVDPLHPDQLFVLATDYAGAVLDTPATQVRVAPTCRLSHTDSRGDHWSSADFAGSHAPAVPYLSSSNATLAMDRQGRLFAACLANNGSGGAVVVATGTAATGLSHSQLLIPPGAGPLVTADKPWLAVSDDGATVAVVWAEFVSNPGGAQIVASFSHDRGTTFGPPQPISGPLVGADDEPEVSAGLPCALFLPSGALVVAWHASLASGEDVMALTVAGTSTHPSTVIALRNAARSGVQGRYPRHANQPSLAFDPATRTLVLAGGVQTGSGVRAALVQLSTAGALLGAPTLVAPAGPSTDELNAAVGTTARGSTGVVYQAVTRGVLDTWVALRAPGSRSWQQVRVSSRQTNVSPYTATDSGTPIGDFLMLVRARHGLVTVFPQQRGDLLQLRGALVVLR